MKVIHYECRNCRACFPAQPNRRARWLAAGVGAAVGGALTRSILWSLAFGGASYWAAGKLHTLVARRCPNCHHLADPIVEEIPSPIRGEEEGARAA